MIAFNPQVRFDLGPLSLHLWGIMVGAGILVSVLMAYEEAHRRRFHAPAKIFDAGIWGVLGAVLGGRIFYFFDKPSVLLENPAQLFSLWDGGMALYGGIAGACIAMAIFSRIANEPLLEILDIYAFAFPAGLFLGRLGCVAIHDHVGKLTTMPWGFAMNGTVRHEPALYLSLFALGIFLLFVRFRSLNPRRFSGFYVVAFLLLYGTGRFFIDFTRETAGQGIDPHFYGLNLAQYVSMGIVALGLVLIFYLRRKKDYLFT